MTRGGSFHQELGEALRQGEAPMAGFIGSILSGFGLGYLADWWLGTDPWLVIGGIVAGSVSGFYQMMRYAKEQERRGR